MFQIRLLLLRYTRPAALRAALASALGNNLFNLTVNVQRSVDKAGVKSNADCKLIGKSGSLETYGKDK